MCANFAILTPDMTFAVDWALNNNDLSIPMGSRPDMTFAVDWALNNNDLSIYLTLESIFSKSHLRTCTAKMSRYSETNGQNDFKFCTVIGVILMHVLRLGHNYA